MSLPAHFSTFPLLFGNSEAEKGKYAEATTGYTSQKFSGAHNYSDYVGKMNFVVFRTEENNIESFS
jgi:hypothetical protein